MGRKDKDEGSDEFELDLDFDSSEGATKPGNRPKNRERRTTQSGGSHAPPSLDAPTVRPPDDTFRLDSPVRHSMIPGPGLDVDDTSSRPTDPGPGRPRVRKRTDSTQQIPRNAGNKTTQTSKNIGEMSEEECFARLGSPERIPKVKISEDEVFALGLDHRAGFLYSQIDGVTSLEDLLSISPMSREDSLRIFVKFLEHDAIELK